MKKVLIYTTPTCAYCTMAKDFFKEKGIEYESKDVSVDSDARDEMIQKSGQMGVPVIVISEDGSEDTILVGFDKGKISSTLGITS